MAEERRVRTRTPEWQALAERIDIAMGLTAQLNALPFADLTSRRSVLTELLGKPLPESVHVMPPFYCTYGLGLDIGGRSSIGQDCSFLDLGGITIGERTMISPKVTLITEGHPLDPAERRDFITLAPIVIESDVWIGAAATVLPGVTIGHDSVVGAGAIVAKDVPPLSVVTGTSHLERRPLQ
jgi:acetyltransferase-like isoleucine patch superfamily enzyme